jgi:ABC-2 type transport system permease protein
MTVDLFLLRTALRDVVRPRRLTTAVVLALLPGAIGLLWRTLANKGDFVPGDAYNALAASLVFGFILTILSVIYGTGVVSQEIEQRTIVYLLTRPVPRWRILLAKFAGSTLAITLTVWVSAILLAVAVYGPGRAFTGPLARDLRILPVGALAYGSVFLLLATLLPRPLTFGLLFAFGWETWVPSLPGSFARLSIMSHLRALAPHVASEKSAFLDLFDTDITPWQARLVLGLVIAIALLAALFVFSHREYAPREDTE